MNSTKLTKLEQRKPTFLLLLVAVVLLLRPYHVGNTGSRPITEVKQRRAQLVLGCVTAWE